MYTYVMNAPHTSNSDDLDFDELDSPGPNPTCCSHLSAMCHRCKEMAKQMGLIPPRVGYVSLGIPVANRDYDPRDVLGVPEMDFPNPFESLSKEDGQITKPGSLFVNYAPPNGIGQPEMVFENPHGV